MTKSDSAEIDLKPLIIIMINWVTQLTNETAQMDYFFYK